MVCHGAQPVRSLSYAGRCEVACLETQRLDYLLERIVRDLRVHQILEGTNEIMRVITARETLK